MAKDDIAKIRKKLTKLIRKFNKEQVEYAAVGKHADNTDIVMIIGSWAEYFYPLLFKTDFIPNIRTRDVDFFYRNINIPKEKSM